MLLPNQQKKALFQLSVESAGGAKGKRRFQNRLFCMKKSQLCKLSRQHVLQLQQFPFGVAVPKRLCQNFKLTIVKAYRCAGVFILRNGRCLR